MRDLIVAAGSETEVELVPITTSGDKIKGPLAPVGGKGLYVKEIEEALLAGRVDIAVHSMKDLPCDIPPGLSIVAVSTREDPRDALLIKSAGGVDSLPRGARIGTTSLRRQHQFGAIRPDCEFTPVRGNVDTRVRKLSSGEHDALVMAMAGLIRLQIVQSPPLPRWRTGAIHISPLSIDEMIPSIGQGVLAIEGRPEDAELAVLVRCACNDATTEIAMAAERAVMCAVGGDCFTPLAAYAELRDGHVHLRAWLATTDGTRSARAEGAVELVANADAVTVANELGRQVGSELKEKLSTHHGRD